MPKPEYINNSEEWANLFTCEILEQSNTQRIAKLTPTDGCQNPHGFLHGGIQALAIDELTMKFLYIPQPDYRFLTVRMSIEYIKPIRIVPFKIDIKIDKIDFTSNRGSAIINLYTMSDTLLTTANNEFAMFRKK
jgi:acyl-coenzyme A thioesterase PaaI-like protein